MRPLPQRLMTLEEFIALPEDNSAIYELQEGLLVVLPRSARPNQIAVSRLANQVNDEIPDEWEAIVHFEVVVRAVEPATLRVPDLVVARTGGPAPRIDASEALLAVEFLSPGSRRVDLHLRPYAVAGIPHYWVADVAPPVPTITAYGLGAPGEGYVESQTAAHEMVVDAPFPMRIDIDALVGPRRR